MQIPILIEPIDGGRFRARAGEPFALCAEAASETEAADLLGAQLRERLRAGAVLDFIDLSNGANGILLDEVASPQSKEDDWFFAELEREIAENRRLEEEDEATRRVAEDKGA